MAVQDECQALVFAHGALGFFVILIPFRRLLLTKREAEIVLLHGLDHFAITKKTKHKSIKLK